MQYSSGMKTAVSIPNEIFESADALAGELGLSRSALYARAVAEYVAKHEGADITARLNEVYSGEAAGGLDEAWHRAQAESVADEEC